MGKNADWIHTYTTAEDGNVRYASSATKSIAGWAYVLTYDEQYVSDLSTKRRVQVKDGDRWVEYAGYLPDRDGKDSPPADISQEWEERDPDY